MPNFRQILSPESGSASTTRIREVSYNADFSKPDPHHFDGAYGTINYLDGSQLVQQISSLFLDRQLFPANKYQKLIQIGRVREEGSGKHTDGENDD